MLLLLVATVLTSISCKKDDPAPATGLSLSALQGDWAVTSGEGTEWEEGVGIVTPRADDPSLVGYKFSITSTTITVKDITGTTVLGSVAYTLDPTTGVISAGNGASGLGVYTIKNFVAGATMDWDQREPIAEDYEPQSGCGCNLAFQKFLKFAKM
jgi:hypothetical protein